jgi:hypothetical protein
MSTADVQRVRSRVVGGGRAVAAGVLIVMVVAVAFRWPGAILGRPLEAWRVAFFVLVVVDAVAIPLLHGAHRRGRRRIEVQLYASLHDELTGLANRALFRDRANTPSPIFISAR